MVYGMYINGVLIGKRVLFLCFFCLEKAEDQNEKIKEFEAKEVPIKYNGYTTSRLNKQWRIK